MIAARHCRTGVAGWRGTGLAYKGTETAGSPFSALSSTTPPQSPHAAGGGGESASLEVLATCSIGEVSGRLKRGELGAAAVIAWTLDRLDSAHARFNCLAGHEGPCRGRAFQAAAESERRFTAGEARGPLEGIPVLIKDNFCVHGEVMTCASEVGTTNQGCGSGLMVIGMWRLKGVRHGFITEFIESPAPTPSQLLVVLTLLGAGRVAAPIQRGSGDGPGGGRRRAGGTVEHG